MPLSMPCNCCGSPVAFEEHDRGYEVYCRSCGRANEVPLTGPEDEAARPPNVPVAVRTTKAGTLSAPRTRRSRRRLHPAWILVLGSLFGGGLWLATQTPKEVFSRWLGRDPLDDLPDLEASADAFSGAAAASAEPPFEPVPDPEVTLARIDELTRRRDPLDALIQAQVWQESLTDLCVPSNDLRHARLKEAVVQLKTAVAPSESELARRRREIGSAMEAVVVALRSSDVAGARKGFDRAWGLARNEPDMASQARRLVTLKVRLDTQEAAAQGAAGIHRCLEQAEKALDLGQVSEAIQAEARAKFLARITPGLSEADAQQLRDRVQRLSPRLQFARGRRASMEARQADGLRDPATRDRQAFRAYSLLAGLPEGEIRPLLEGLREWHQRALRAGGPERLPGPSSPLGREIQWRGAYETVLRHYGDADCANLAVACRNLGAAEQASPRARPAGLKGHIRPEQCLFDVLERDTVARLAAVPEPQSDRLEPTLIALRELLDQAGAWQDHDRWQLLDAAMRQEGNALALTRMKSALALADQGRLQEAAREAEWAGCFGWSEVRQRADRMKNFWQAELHLRASADVQERAWQRLLALNGRSERVLQFWYEAQRFMKLFPRSTHRREVEGWAARAETGLPAHVTAAIQDATEMMNRQDWSGARVRWAWLRGAPVPPADASAFDALKTRFSEVKAAAEHEFLLLEQWRPPTEESHVRAILERLPQVLAMDPDHSEARELLQLTRRQAALRAGKLVNAAIPLHAVNSSACRGRLRRAVLLDGDGPCGTKARELLDQYDGHIAVHVVGSGSAEEQLQCRPHTPCAEVRHTACAGYNEMRKLFFGRSSKPDSAVQSP